LTVKIAIPRSQTRHSGGSGCGGGRRIRGEEDCRTRSHSPRKRQRSAHERSRSTHKRSRSSPPHSRSPHRSQRRTSWETNKLFVRGLGSLQDEQKLKQVFREFGKVVDVFIVSDEDKKSRGFGFVTFESSSGAKKALSTSSIKLDGRPLGVNRAKVKVVSHTRRGERTRRPRSYSEPKEQNHHRVHGYGSHSCDLRKQQSYPFLRRHNPPRRPSERRGYGSDRRGHTEPTLIPIELGKPSRRQSRSSRHSTSGHLRHSTRPRQKERATPEKHSRSHRRREHDYIR